MWDSWRRENIIINMETKIGGIGFHVAIKILLELRYASGTQKGWLRLAIAFQF